MAALDLTDKAAVLDYVAGLLPSEDESALEALLEASAAWKADDCDAAVADPDLRTVVYRPWWVLASCIASNPSAFESVTSATGATVSYRDPAAAVAALMARQRAFDRGSCHIPDGFDAVAPGSPGSRSVVRAYA